MLIYAKKVKTATEKIHPNPIWKWGASYFWTMSPQEEQEQEEPDE